jgi:hypothetical protein
MTAKISVFHQDDDGLRRAIADGDTYLLSTRSGNSETPKVHFHATKCGIWKRNAGSAAVNAFTERYVKATSTSLLALVNYVEKNYPNRPRRVCGCCKVAMSEALTAGSSPHATPNSSISGTATLTIAQAKMALAATFGVQPEAVEIIIRG